MLCPRCQVEMRETIGRYQYRECGLDNVFLEDWPMFVCGGCELKLPRLPDAESLVAPITRYLVVQPGRLDGDTILFLRKAMALTSAEFAAVLRVERVTVSRWENNKSNIDGLSDLRLRLEAIDRLLPPTMRKEILETLVPVFQHQYTTEIMISQKEIVVPRSVPDGELAVTMSG